MHARLQPNAEVLADTALAYQGPRDVLIVGRWERDHAYIHLSGEPRANARLDPVALDERLGQADAAPAELALLGGQA